MHDDAEPDGENTSVSPTLLVSADLPISPSEIIHTYGDLVHRMVLHIGISMSQPLKIVDDVVFDVIQAQLFSAVATPITKIMREAAQSSWSKPSSIPISSKRLDHMHHMEEESAAFLFHHPS